MQSTLKNRFVAICSLIGRLLGIQKHYKASRGRATVCSCRGVTWSRDPAMNICSCMTGFRIPISPGKPVFRLRHWTSEPIIRSACYWPPTIIVAFTWFSGWWCIAMQTCSERARDRLRRSRSASAISRNALRTNAHHLPTRLDPTQPTGNSDASPPAPVRYSRSCRTE